MPTNTIPLVGEETRRGLAQSASTSKDQYFAGCVFTRTSNSATNSANWYVEKRPGFSSSGTIADGSIGTAIFISPSTAKTISAFGGTNSTIYENSTSAGTISGLCYFITETQIGGVTHYLFTSADGTGWYLVNGATSDTSFTGDTHTNTIIDNIAGAAGIYVGQLITGTGIAANTRVATRTPDTSTPTSITTTIATTGTASITITKEPIAKIIDTDFPSCVGGFAAMDGYIFVGTATGRVYNSDINSVISWGADNYITANISTDTGMGVINYKNHIISFGKISTELFYNAGNPSGSILSSRKELFSQVGMYAGAGPYNSVCQINDGVYWLGNDMCLYTFEGLVPKKLSEQGMKLGNISFPPYSVYGFRIGVDTIIHVLSSQAASDKWYSLNTNKWIEPNFSLIGMIIANNETPTTANCGVAVSSNSTLGNVYGLDTATYQDNAVAFTLTIQTEPKVLNKGKGFIINSVELLADNQSSGSTQLEISRDDYTTFQVLGNFGLTSRRKRITRGGFCRNHAIFRLTDSGNQAWRGQALVVDWTPCAT